MSQEPMRFEQALAISSLVEKRDELWIYQVQMVVEDGVRSKRHGTFRMFLQDPKQGFSKRKPDGSSFCYNFTSLDDCKVQLTSTGVEGYTFEPIGIENGWMPVQQEVQS